LEEYRLRLIAGTYTQTGGIGIHQKISGTDQLRSATGFQRHAVVTVMQPMQYAFGYREMKRSHQPFFYG
jgi:hypothetical protein